MPDVEVDLVRRSADVAEVGIAHLARTVDDAAHDGDLHALEVRGRGADAGGGLLNVVVRAPAGGAGDVLGLRQAHARGLKDVEGEFRRLLGIALRAHENGVADAVAEQRTDVEAARHGGREALRQPEAVLEQNAVARRNEGGEQAEGLYDGHVDAVGHGDERGRGLGQGGDGSGIARVDGDRRGVLEAQLGHEVLHLCGVERLEGRAGQHDAHGLVPAERDTAAGDDVGLALAVAEGVEGGGGRLGEVGGGVLDAGLEGRGEFKARRHLVHGVLRERDAQGVADAVGEQRADADGALDAGIFALTGLGHAEVHRVVPVLSGLFQTLDEQAVGLNHDLDVRGLHRKDELVVAEVSRNARKLQSALHHAPGRVAVAVEDAIRERAVVGADAHGAPVLLAEEDEGGEGEAHALELLLVLGVGVVALDELLFVDEVAGVDADFLNPLGGLHGGIGLEVDVGHERHVAAGGVELAGDVLEIRGVDLGLGREADDLAARLSEGKRFAHAACRVQRVAREHGLNADGVVAAEAEVADGDFAADAAGVAVQARAMLEGHGTNLLLTPLDFKSESRARAFLC